MTLDDEVSDMSGGAGWTGVSGDGGLQPAGTTRPSGSCHCWARGGEDLSSDLRNAHLQTRRWPKPHINSRFKGNRSLKTETEFSSVKQKNRSLEVQNALYHTIKNYWTLEKENTLKYHTFSLYDLCAILLLHRPESCKKEFLICKKRHNIT